MPVYRRRKVYRRYGTFRKRRNIGTRRKYVRRRPYFKRKMPVFRNPLKSMQPTKMLVRNMKYHCSKTFSLTNLALKGYFNFNAAGIYDPDMAVGGHQPWFHDRLESIYQFYRVVRSKIYCTYYPNASQLIGGLGLIYVKLNDGDVDFVDTNLSDDGIIEALPASARSIIHIEEEKPTTIRAYYKCPDRTADSLYVAGFGADPAQSFVYEVGARNLPAVNEMTIVLHITIVYDVLVWHPAEINASS